MGSEFLLCYMPPLGICCFINSMGQTHEALTGAEYQCVFLVAFPCGGAEVRAECLNAFTIR